MDDLFEKLKAEPPINKNISSAPPSPPRAVVNESLDENLISELRINENSSPRRESMPPPNSPMIIKTSANKSRSVSPPKLSKSEIKQFKVKIERKNLDNLLNNSLHKKELTSKKKSTTNSSTIDEPKLKKTTPAKDENKSKKATPPKEEPKIKKMTPTKAQQKLFDPVVLLKAEKLKEFKIKRCAVRLQRSNLKKLQTEFAAKRKARKSHKQKAATPKIGEKRKHDSSSIFDSPPEKRGRPSMGRGSGNSPTKDGKQKLGGFFIKLSPANKQKTLANKAKPTQLATKDKSPKNRQPSYKTTTHKPTKFTRSQLIKTFGKRFFCSRVKIERCAHPLMLIFDSNARARRLQSKRNQKSKNLSVSFKEQVEVFGNSDSDSDDESDATASTSQAAQHKLQGVTAALIPVMPARLKKVENGKVIDDIEFDTSWFMDPKSGAGTSSTPFQSPGRKKREKKSYSPLKGDGTPSPRKEQLKLANEKMPPSGLRRLNIDDDIDDDDDDDDDCEYIVPIDIPQRRTSRASSFTAADRSPAAEPMDSETSASSIANTDESPARASMETKTMKTDSAAATNVPIVDSNVTESSGSSFASAIDQPTGKEGKTKKNVICDDLMPSAAEVLSKEVESTSETNRDVGSNALETIDSDNIIENLSKHIDPSPVPSLNSIRDLVDSVINICAGGNDFDIVSNRSTTNATSNNNDNTNANGGGDAKIVPSNDMQNDDDISLKLFVEENSECDRVSSDSSIANEKQQLRAPTPNTVLIQSKVSAE